MIVDDGCQPRADRRTVRVQKQDVAFGVVGLPDRIWTLGTVPIDHLEPVAIRRVTLARSVPDARDIADALVERGVKLALGASVYDPTDPMGKMFFNIVATFAAFEADLIRMRTREGMAIARAKGKLRGKQPKL
ncbi:recombinase family protein [Xanthomonas populi]